MKPTLTIQAIGRGVIEGTIGNLYSSKVNMVNIKDGEKYNYRSDNITLRNGKKLDWLLNQLHRDSSY